MNGEQSAPGKAAEAEQDTSKVFPGDSVNDDYYAVDKPKKELSTTIGDGEMRNEGTVGEGNIPEENPFSAEGLADEQDKALQDSGD